MKRFFKFGLLTVCGSVGVHLIGGCSRNTVSDNDSVASTNETTVATNPTPSQPETTPQSATTQPTKIHWEPNFNQALQRARQSQKPIMIDFFATWCGPCKMLDEVIYPTAEVVQEAQNFISVKVDIDQHQALAQQYKITSLPTIVFLDALGREIYRTQGIAAQPSWLVGEMQNARSKVAPTAA